jgi:hypothetical protein
MSERTRTVITGFAQGPAGNCTSIGFIKAVIHSYDDPGRLLRVTHPRDGGLEATTLSEARLSISKDELARAATAAHLVSRTTDGRSLLDSANQLFAVMGKACQLDCAGKRAYCPYAAADRCTFDGALTYLDSGLNWWIPPALLGMAYGRDYSQIAGWKVGRWFRSVRFTAGARSCVAATPKHTFFVADGAADNHGHAVKFSSKFASWFAFKSIAAYCLTGEPASVEMEDESPDHQPSADVLADPELREIW